MSKDDRSPLNPFTGKKHFDSVDDDKFLAECYKAYYAEVQKYQLLDNTDIGKQVINISLKIINTVQNYLQKIERQDYVDGYYDWEVHLVQSEIANACCFPGGKIIVYSGIVNMMENESELAFVLGHEISHALLDHSRTQQSIQQSKNTVSQVSWIGSFALDMLGLGGVGNIARAAINAADVGSHLFLTQPWGRDHELEADKLGLIFCYLAGYDVKSIPHFWKKFSAQNGNDFDFFSTHPSDEKRITVMKESVIEVFNDNDFYSKPLLPETPKADKQIDDAYYEQMTQSRNPQASIPNQNNSHCTNCGNALNPEDNFCTQCGAKR